jgi:hypothetical protein
LQRFRSGYQAQNCGDFVPGGSLTKTLLRVWEKHWRKMRITGFRMAALDKLSEDDLLTMALASQKNPTKFIGDMVRGRIALAQ